MNRKKMWHEIYLFKYWFRIFFSVWHLPGPLDELDSSVAEFPLTLVPMTEPVQLSFMTVFKKSLTCTKA